MVTDNCISYQIEWVHALTWYFVPVDEVEAPIAAYLADRGVASDA